jgi:2-(3-amino-3-carboxypropyl)histidine synthase
LLAKTSRPIYVYNPFTENLKLLSEVEKQKLWKRKVLQLAKFKDAKTIGILVSMKPGQFCATAENIKKSLEKQGKKVYLFACDSITNAELMNFPHIEAWVNTACPRIAEDEFSRPLVNAADLDL